MFVNIKTGRMYTNFGCLGLIILASIGPL